MHDQSSFPASFGELLKAARKHRGITQRQLAQRLGMHPNTISAWELGTYLPATRGLVLELARRLSLDVPATRQLLEASLTALSPHWSVPLPRSPFFTGREEILQTLHDRLGSHQAVALTRSYALHGLGGIGKTQIALEYAYRYALEYSAVFWIGAETVESVIASLLHIAEVLQLPERHDQDRQRVIAAVLRWLSTHHQWLVICDNVDEPELLQEFLPPERPGALLVTTRCPALGPLALGLEVQPMGAAEGLLLLLRRANVLVPPTTLHQVPQGAIWLPAEYAAAEELVAVLAGFPLALDQAGAYLQETGCRFVEYLHHYQQQRGSLLSRRGTSAGYHPQSVATTFQLAMERIKQEQQAAAELLSVCACLQAEAIPEELFLGGAAHLGARLEALQANPFHFDQAIAVLRHFSLIERQAETHTLSLHRLVQAVLLESMTATERTQWSRRVIEALNAIFPEVCTTMEYALWAQCERFLPHALVCLQQEPEEESSLASASLAYQTARYLYVRGRYGEAEPLYQRALRIREQQLGLEHPDVASPLYGLATLSVLQGRYAEAEPLYQRVLRLRERELGPEHPDVAASLNNLAELYGAQDKYAEAEPLYQRALGIWERQLGPEHPHVGHPLDGLATIYRAQGNYAKAELLYQRALGIWEQRLGPGHPQVAYPLTGLAALYARQEKDAEAEPLYQRALRLREQQLGPMHPATAETLHDFATFRQRQGKPQEALAYFQQALIIREPVLGAHHPKTQETRTAYDALLERMGKDQPCGEDDLSVETSQKKLVGKNAQVSGESCAGPAAKPRCP